MHFCLDVGTDMAQAVSLREPTPSVKAATVNPFGQQSAGPASRWAHGHMAASVGSDTKIELCYPQAACGERLSTLHGRCASFATTTPTPAESTPAPAG